MFNLCVVTVDDLCYILAMKSNVSINARKALIELYRSMSPRQRLVAFLNHSRLLHKLCKAGEQFRSQTRAYRSRSLKRSSR